MYGQVIHHFQRRLSAFFALSTKQDKKRVGWFLGKAVVTFTIIGLYVNYHDNYGSYKTAGLEYYELEASKREQLKLERS